MKSKRTDPAPASAPNHPGLAAPEKAPPGAWRKHHVRLLQLRERVIRDTMEFSTEAAPIVFSPHCAEPQTDSFDRDLAFILLSFEEDALGEIDAALKRIRDGRYGRCELTGEPIPKQRLDAIPWARYTARAQVEVERATETRRARPEAVGSTRPGAQDLK
jgi:RNA polymerase-binding transcription factor DksA